MLNAVVKFCKAYSLHPLFISSLINCAGSQRHFSLAARFLTGETLFLIWDLIRHALSNSPFLCYSSALLEARTLFCKTVFTLGKYVGKQSPARQPWPESVTATPVKPKIAAGGSKKEKEVVEPFEIPSISFRQAEMPPGWWPYLQPLQMSLRRREALYSEPYRELSSCPSRALLRLAVCQLVEKKKQLSAYALLWCLADSRVNQLKREFPRKLLR